MPRFAPSWRPRSGRCSAMRLPAICFRAHSRSARRRSSAGRSTAPQRCRFSYLIGFSPTAVLVRERALHRRWRRFTGDARADSMMPKRHRRSAGMGLRGRRAAGAGAGRGDFAQIRRRRRVPRRPDLRSFQDRDHRRDGAAGSAAGQSDFCRSRRAGPAGLLLSLAFFRRRTGAAARTQAAGKPISG